VEEMAKMSFFMSGNKWWVSKSGNRNGWSQKRWSIGKWIRT
jgi:hypothetical protein